ncbi:MAG: HAD-IIIA family hydrolase, partial [Desulfobacterales bacterium]|nr:HAD-IIIA family hydrolase [Desulfobacterales bacterium]
PPQNLAEFEILEGVDEALHRLKNAGFWLVVVTNQPDVAKGIQRREVVDAMHDLLRAMLPVDDIRVCWCPEGPSCDCYKPKPGLLLEAARDLGIDLARSFMVGDRWRDVGAGRAAGCFTVFLDRGYAEPLVSAPDATCRDLEEAASVILARHGGSH